MLRHAACVLKKQEEGHAVRTAGSKEESQSGQFMENPLLGILGFKCGHD